MVYTDRVMLQNLYSQYDSYGSHGYVVCWPQRTGGNNDWTFINLKGTVGAIVLPLSAQNLLLRGQQLIMTHMVQF